ncbi:hypothetical protein Zm00014a_019557 [Zea mays]|uniref:F-box domain-containing protein n=1 Tax=Zea mays TaxID=4577 RepID=A0A3L6F3L6_MAIZE|nr:hypothetical protein Zm00014a_019557 [Zea mays]
MAAESCHPRGLSWFARSCIPADPARHTAVPVPVPVPFSVPDAEDPEPEPPIAGLPDELLLEILARVPRASLPPLPAVCRRFASLLASQAFLQLRRASGRLRPCLLAVSSSSARALLLHLHASASASASASSLEVSALPLPPRCGGAAFAHARAVAVGRHVYLVGRGATLRVDPLTGAARACAATLFPRSKFAAAAWARGSTCRAARRAPPRSRSTTRRPTRGASSRRPRAGGTAARARAPAACSTSPEGWPCPEEGRRGRRRWRRTRAPGRWTRCTWGRAPGRGRGRGRCPAAAASWARAAPGTATSTWLPATRWTSPSGGGTAEAAEAEAGGWRSRRRPCPAAPWGWAWRCAWRWPAWAPTGWRRWSTWPP